VPGASVADLVTRLRTLDAAHGGNLFRRAGPSPVQRRRRVAASRGQEAQVSRQLYTVAADLAQLVAWMSHDTQLHGTAPRY